MLDLIGRLYAVEAQVPVLRADTTAADRAGTLALRAQLRAEQSRAIVGEIRAWAQGQRALPRSMLGNAITLIESAKLCGVDPKAYLLTATRAALTDRTAVTLPHELLQ